MRHVFVVVCVPADKNTKSFETSIFQPFTDKVKAKEAAEKLNKSDYTAIGCRYTVKAKSV